MIFHDWTDELDALASAFESPGSDVFVVYGRRRVGKTELLKEFCTDRPHIYRGNRPSASGLDPEDERRQRCTIGTSPQAESHLPPTQGILPVVIEKYPREFVRLVRTGAGSRGRHHASKDAEKRTKSSHSRPVRSSVPTERRNTRHSREGRDSLAESR
jgi:hypothetical protein